MREIYHNKIETIWNNTFQNTEDISKLPKKKIKNRTVTYNKKHRSIILIDKVSINSGDPNYPFIEFYDEFLFENFPESGILNSKIIFLLETSDGFDFPNGLFSGFLYNNKYYWRKQDSQFFLRIASRPQLKNLSNMPGFLTVKLIFYSRISYNEIQNPKI